jgi:hypothetical protein
MAAFKTEFFISAVSKSENRERISIVITSLQKEFVDCSHLLSIVGTGDIEGLLLLVDGPEMLSLVL